MPVEGVFRGRQHAAQTAARQQRASSAVEAETLHQGLILFVAAHELADPYFAGWPRQYRAAARAAYRAHEANLGEILDDLVKMVARDDKLARQHVGADVFVRGLADSRIRTRWARSVELSNRIGPQNWY
jgi:hypothetical protein